MTPDEASSSRDLLDAEGRGVTTATPDRRGRARRARRSARRGGPWSLCQVNRTSDREVLEAPDQERQEPRRGVVGPLQVLDDGDARRRPGERLPERRADRPVETDLGAGRVERRQRELPAPAARVPARAGRARRARRARAWEARPGWATRAPRSSSVTMPSARPASPSWQRAVIDRPARARRAAAAAPRRSESCPSPQLLGARPHGRSARRSRRPPAALP